MTAMEKGGMSAHNDTVALRVRYAPAKKPYVDPHATGTLTLQEVKKRALEEFKLVEGSVEGGSKAYQLSFEDVVQTDLSLTLHALVKHGKELELLLVEQFTQG